MRLGTFTNSSQLIRSYSICVRWHKYHGRQNCFIFLQTLYQNHKATAQSDCNIYIAILFRMSKEKNNLYDTSWARQRLHRLHKSFILCCTSIWKKTETQSLLWYWSYIWHSRFFKSLKLHFDICNILICNKMTIKWKDLHCRLLKLHLYSCVPQL